MLELETIFFNVWGIIFWNVWDWFYKSGLIQLSHKLHVHKLYLYMNLGWTTIMGRSFWYERSIARSCCRYNTKETNSVSVKINAFVNVRVKSVRIRSFSVSYFPAFGLNGESYAVSLHIQSECWEIRSRKTLNTDTSSSVYWYIPQLYRVLLLLRVCVNSNHCYWNTNY